MNITKDKKYIEALFRNYKKNIARKKVLELGLITDDDYTLGAIDYSRDKIQTSNKPTLDNFIEARERELHQLNKDIAITEILLESLDSRKDSQYRKLIENYYIEKMTQSEVMRIINIYDNRYFFNLCSTVLNSLVELIN